MKTIKLRKHNLCQDNSSHHHPASRRRERGTMTRRLLFLLTCLTCAELVGCLECYICLTPTPASRCLARKNCSEYQQWCSSTTYGPTSSGIPFDGEMYVIRNCAEKCVSSNPNTLGVTQPTRCCKEDRCNVRSGAWTMAAGGWALPTVLWPLVVALRGR